jgi:hypothetical protein
MKPIPLRPDYSARGRPAQYFERAAYAECLAAMTPYGGKTAAQIAKEQWPDDAATPRLLTKGAVNPATTGTASWAGSLAIDATTDFVATLAPASAAARLRNAGMKVSLTGENSVKLPRRNAAPATNIAWVPEGGAIPVGQYSLDAVQVGPACKLAGIAVLTRAMIIDANGQQTVSTLLREDFAATLDYVVFGTAAAVAGTNPAGLLNGVSPLTATTGGDVTGQEAMLQDLNALAGVIADGGGSEVVYIAATRQALAAKTRLPRADSITIWPCSQLAAGTVIAVEPNAFVSAISPEPMIEAAIDGAVHMASPASPLATGTGPTVATPIRSLYQTDSIALRCMLDLTWAMRASNMVAYLTGATWGNA